MSEQAIRERSLRRAWATPGASHDRVIAVVRIVVPAAIGALAAVLALAPLTMGGEVSFVLAKDTVAVAKERMRVSEALYRGEDSRGRPFSIRAGSAVQTTSRDPVVRINDMQARIALNDGPAVLRANTGRYDMDREIVNVDGPLLFESADGYRLATRDVAIDLKSRKLASGGAVTGRMPIGTFSAQSMSADLNTRTVALDGRARLRIVQGAAR